MFKELVEAFEESKDTLRERFSKRFYTEYKDIVQEVVEVLAGVDVDVSKYWTASMQIRYNHRNVRQQVEVTEVSSGDYQGCLLYIVPAYHSGFFYTLVDYGSCSVCDSLQYVNDLDRDYEVPYAERKPSKRQVDEYMTMALHIVQKFKFLPEYEMGDD